MSYPTDPEFQSINFRSNTPTASNTSLSGKKTVRALGGQRWEFTASYDRLTKAEFSSIYSFLISQGGMLGEFDVVPTEISSTRGTAAGNVRVNGAHSAGDTTINIDGLGGSETLLKGDLIKFSAEAHTKVYMVTEDRVGDGVLTIFPALVVGLVDNELLVYNNVPLKVRLANDIQEYSLSSNNQYTFEVDFVESI